MKQQIRKFAKNESGRDFVVGDIHGCFDKLEAGLEAVGFDECSDRLFSVGDLVDRGPSSIDAIDWIAKPWFHAVRGNHEQMAIGVAAGRHDLGNYLVNGGGWFLELDQDRQKLVAEVLDSLPLCIEIAHEKGRVGIVHADIYGDSWDHFCQMLESPLSNNKRKPLTEIALWSRSRITDMANAPIIDLEVLFVGHTPVERPLALGNVVYVDTGAVFGRNLTIREIGSVITVLNSDI